MLPTLLSLATYPAFFRSFRLVSSLSSAHRLPLILARPRRPLVALREPTVASHTPPTSVHPTESKFPFRPGGHDTSRGADIVNMSGRKVMVQPINILFSLLQKRGPPRADRVQHTRVVIWLYDNNEFRIEAYLIGFDEFMNVVLDDAEEVYDCSAKPGKEVKPRRELGRILLKGDNITLVQPAQA
ncbi:mRNA splicing protein sme1 [Saitozyma podzolica]|uniref:Small nuclear ribonucleoprotein E n=1 Tax=Saitozyma podzolica TaxID=1890683 RepID=A0A427YI15_9TREE|nr:mRNA splicing protein sme1 [Saitozyma podzolica]